MGLSTTHNCFSAPYSVFDTFRRSLAKEIGINLEEYIGHGWSGTKEVKTISSPLMPLFKVCALGGVLSSIECFKIANELNEILIKIDYSKNINLYLKEQIIRFKEGCLDAFSKGESVLFN